MREYLRKLGVVATAALTIAGASIATTGTALAQHRGGGGMHMGRVGGFGGMHVARAGGAWHGGHWGGGHWRGGWHRGWGWRGGGWHRGWGWGGWGPAFAAGVAIGTWPYWGPYWGPYAYAGCYRQVVINRWGHRVVRRICY